MEPLIYAVQKSKTWHYRARNSSKSTCRSYLWVIVKDEENVLLILKYPLARVILKREGENVRALDYSTFGFQHWIFNMTKQRCYTWIDEVQEFTTYCLSGCKYFKWSMKQNGWQFWVDGGIYVPKLFNNTQTWDNLSNFNTVAKVTYKSLCNVHKLALSIKCKKTL